MKCYKIYPEQIEQRAKENSEMYWAAREREEQVKTEQDRIRKIIMKGLQKFIDHFDRDKMQFEIHRPFRQR